MALLYPGSCRYSVFFTAVRGRYGGMLHEVMKLFDEVYLCYFDLSLEETLRRHRTKPNSHEFGEEQMRQWYTEKDN